MNMVFPLEKFRALETPFYYYDLERLGKTLQNAREEAGRYQYLIQYALKANANERLVSHIVREGLGADCVSGQEVEFALHCGFTPEKIVFAGVGKSDGEILSGLRNHIACFNVESIPEMEVINELAGSLGEKTRIAVRINPNIDPQTHHYITTGLEENKFGINQWELDDVLLTLEKCTNLKLTGIHFHIGSQITDLSVFKSLCLHANQFQEWFLDHHIMLEHLNVGGGLGVDYNVPDDDSQPDFAAFFRIFHDFLQLKPGQRLHFELGRSLVAQCGSLITKVLYVKKGMHTRFAIVDAGMTELLRPALYQAYHKIENLTSTLREEKYDVVGPICESSDTFAKAFLLPETQRGDLLAIRSTGAYGETMASRYNLRDLVKAVYSDNI
jgi:diaminopimelate decarboxylase